jgi:hypothetical protein
VYLAAKSLHVQHSKLQPAKAPCTQANRNWPRVLVGALIAPLGTPEKGASVRSEGGLPHLSFGKIWSALL